MNGFMSGRGSVKGGVATKSQFLWLCHGDLHPGYSEVGIDGLKFWPGCWCEGCCSTCFLMFPVVHCVVHCDLKVDFRSLISGNFAKTQLGCKILILFF